VLGGAGLVGWGGVAGARSAWWILLWLSRWVIVGRVRPVWWVLLGWGGVVDGWLIKCFKMHYTNQIQVISGLNYLP
jgi:hypothetical protein